MKKIAIFQGLFSSRLNFEVGNASSLRVEFIAQFDTIPISGLAFSAYCSMRPSLPRAVSLQGTRWTPDVSHGLAYPRSRVPRLAGWRYVG